MAMFQRLVMDSLPVHVGMQRIGDGSKNDPRGNALVMIELRAVVGMEMFRLTIPRGMVSDRISMC